LGLLRGQVAAALLAKADSEREAMVEPYRRPAYRPIAAESIHLTGDEAPRRKAGRYDIETIDEAFAVV
jgi:hypothetical protein